MVSVLAIFDLELLLCYGGFYQALLCQLDGNRLRKNSRASKIFEENTTGIQEMNKQLENEKKKYYWTISSMSYINIQWTLDLVTLTVSSKTVTKNRLMSLNLMIYVVN